MLLDPHTGCSVDRSRSGTHHFLKNSPQFIVIHTVKGFSQWSRCFSGTPFFSSMIQRCWQSDLWFLCLSKNLACTFGSSWFMNCWSLAWRILSITLLACEMSAIVQSLNILWHCLSLKLEWNWPFTVLWPLLNFPNIWANLENSEISIKTLNWVVVTSSRSRVR